MSGIFGQTSKFGQPPSLYHSSIIEIKNKQTKNNLIKQTVKILSTVCNMCPNLPGVRIYPTLPILKGLRQVILDIR